jgi:hypothetical protein
MKPDALIEELREAASHLAADAAMHRAQGLTVGDIDVECVEVIADLLHRAAEALGTTTEPKRA